MPAKQPHPECGKNLFIGDREDSRDRVALRTHSVTHIVNCAAELPCCFPEDIRYLQLQLQDPDPEFVRRARPAMAFIDQARKNGGVLVHCTAGVSRSAAIVLNYLCHLGRPLEDACAELSRSVLTGIDPSFLSQMAEDLGQKLSKQDLKQLELLLAGQLQLRKNGDRFNPP